MEGDTIVWVRNHIMINVICLEDRAQEIYARFVCITELTEVDTCTVLARHFGECYFADHYYEENDDCSIFRASMVLVKEGQINNIGEGRFYVPIIPEIVREIESGRYIKEGDTLDVERFVYFYVGDLFDENENLKPILNNTQAGLH